MKKFIITLILYVSFQTIYAQENNFSSNINAFSFNLYENLSKQSVNLVYSPFSINTAMAMPYCGAKSSTKKEMQQVLHFQDDINNLSTSYNDLIRSLKGSFITDNITLNVSNSLWGEETYNFKTEFLDLLKNKFEAPFNPVSFMTDPENCRKKINKQVEKDTENKIKDLIKPSILTTDTRLVLVNALYFLGNWETQFKKENTKKAPFHLSETEEIQTPFMNASLKARYFENELFQAAEIPYQSHAASMYIFIPKNMSGFENLEKTVDLKTFNQWKSEMEEAVLNTSIPKFKIETDIEMSDMLIEMGIKKAFGNKANFKGISKKNDLRIDKVIHKAVFEIDENGTEAAAATAVVMVRKTSINTKVKFAEFKADRPFLFFLVENKNGSILFAGKIQNPDL